MSDTTATTPTDLYSDLTDSEAVAIDQFMGEHMYRHSISNSYNAFACNPQCRTQALAEAVRRHVLVPRREAIAALTAAVAADSEADVSEPDTTIEPTPCPHDYLDRGDEDDHWRECWLCGRIEGSTHCHGCGRPWPDQPAPPNPQDTNAHEQ